MRYVKHIVISIKNCLQVETLWDSAAISSKKEVEFTKSKQWGLSSFFSSSYSSIHSIGSSDAPLSVLILAVGSFDV
jgi:hypothetical protein